MSINTTDLSIIKIVPDVNEIFCDFQQPIARNIVKGSYDSVNAYIVQQFLLLKQDFLNSLKFGINKIRTIYSDNQSVTKTRKELYQIIHSESHKITGLTLYYNTKITSFTATFQGIAYNICLSEEAAAIDWSKSRKVMYGSLVCFSDDFFQNNCHIGIVCGRNINRLQTKHSFYVKFFYMTKEIDLDLISKKKQYLMIEPRAFFETYRHVLNCLVHFQQTYQNEFPFADEIIFSKTDNNKRPDYLEEKFINFRYNFI